MTSLPGIRAGLLCNELDGQMLIYNQHADTIHLLDPTTARVFELLQRGARTKEEVVNQLLDIEGSRPGAALFDLAIHELRKAELLDQRAPSAAPMIGISRRELLRRITLTGAAAAIIPTIVTLSATRAYGQGSCLAKKECCTVDAECCSNKCDASTGTGCTTGPLECH
jgi:hypothetical protein